MILLRYLLIIAGIGLLAGAAAILAWDLYQIMKFRKRSPEEVGELRSTESGQRAFHWKETQTLATAPVLPMLAGLSIAVAASGSAGVRRVCVIAEKLADKARIVIAPNAGKFFFANDVLKGMTTPEIVH